MSENYIVINGKRAELTEEQLKKLGLEIPKNQRVRQDADSAWELAKKISTPICDGGYSFEEIKEILDCGCVAECFLNYTYLEAAAKVAQWEKAKLKPQKTIMQDFFEKFPDAEKDDDGTPVICPYALGYYTETIMCSDVSDNICFECWNRPLEEEGA